MPSSSSPWKQLSGSSLTRCLASQESVSDVIGGATAIKKGQGEIGGWGGGGQGLLTRIWPPPRGSPVISRNFKRFSQNGLIKFLWVFFLKKKEKNV